MTAVIMAGGKGTRVASVNSQIPKPLLPVAGKPVLEHEIECLRRQNITDIILVVGHLGEQIVDYFGDGHAFGVHIEYIREETPLGTAGALYYLKDRLTDDFLLLKPNRKDGYRQGLHVVCCNRGGCMVRRQVQNLRPQRRVGHVR